MTAAAELPHWGDPGHKLAVYDSSSHHSTPRVSVVAVVRHTATQVVVARGDGLELRFYREDGRPVGDKMGRAVLRQLDDSGVQDALAVAALGLLLTKLERLGQPGWHDTAKTIRTRAGVLRAMRQMRREIALAWDALGVNRDDLDQ